MHLYGTSFQLMCSGFPVLVIGLFLLCFLEAMSCVVVKLVVCFALVFFGWHWNPLKMSRISALATSILVLVSQSGIKGLLVLVWRPLFTNLLVYLLLLGLCFFFLHLPFDNSVCWWFIGLIWATCGSPATCFICLAVAFELSIFLASWHTLLAGNLSRSTLPSFIVLETKSSSFRKNLKMSLWSTLAVSGGCLARLIWACTMLYHLSTLLVPCLKLVKRSKWALTSFTLGLQNSSKHSQIASKLRSSLGKPQNTYWSMPKSPLQATTFLHFWYSWSAASLHSSMFFAFKPPFQ